MSDLRGEFLNVDTEGEDATAETVRWTSDLSVNSPTLDLHHQILVGCLNRMILLQSCWQDSLPAVRRELALIMNYCKIHFFVEEAAMRLARVPDETVQTHAGIHRRILGRMEEAIRSFAQDPVRFPFDDTVRFLNMWLVRHIQDEDKQHYGHDLRGRPGIEPELSRYRYSEISRKLRLREDPDRRRAAGDTLSGRWVSVVEGNLERRGTLIRTLQDQGLKVGHAKSVLEAPAMVDSQAPELLFLDWSLQDGPAFARELYRKRNTMVVATHFGDPLEILDACDHRGVANILSYPCSARDIITVTRETLDAFVPLRALVLERLAA